MPFNGSGTYSPPAAPTFPAVPNTLIESSKFNTVINDVATALTNCMTRDGQSPATANIPMGTFKLTNIGSGLADTDSVALSQVPVLKGSIGASDWNNLIKYGTYEAVAGSLTGPAANFPPTSDTGQLIVMPQGNLIDQLYITLNGTYTRQKTGAVWSTWRFAPTVADASLTLNVPGTFATVKTAMLFLQQRTLLPGITATIQIAAGTINEGTAPVNLNHPQGKQIFIDGAGAGSTTWNQATAAQVLFTLDGGHAFGGITDCNLTATSGQIGIVSGGGTDMGEISACTVGTNASISVQQGATVRIGTGTYNVGAGNQFLSLVSGANAYLTGSTVTGKISADGGCTVVYNTVTHSAAANTALDLNTGSFLLCQGGNSTVQNSNIGIQSRNGSIIAVQTGVTLTSQTNTTFGFSYTNALAAFGTIAGAGNGSGLESAALDIGAGALSATTGDLTLTPGAGSNVRFGTFTGAADAASTGYIEIKDSGGTIRRVMVRA